MRYLLLALAALATSLGLVNLYSASLAPDGVPGTTFSAQATHALFALLAFTVASRVPLEQLRRHARLAWLGGVGLLLLTVILGHVAGGARSWLTLGPFRVQASELMKVLLPLALAAELTRPTERTWWARTLRRALARLGLSRRRASKGARGLARWSTVAALIGLPVGLVAAQPDLGVVGLLALGALTVVWLAGVSRWLIAGGALAGLAAAPAGWMLLQDYQRERLFTFLDPTRDPSGAGYQTLQSLYAVASGGWLGRGWATGTQGRLGFLPEHATDFILAHLAEEWGLLGAGVALGLLTALIGVGLAVAERARDPFAALLGAGLSLQVLWQVVVNAGGILGLLPLTGVTLPFFSYGGSSLIALWAAVGLLAGVARAGAPRRRLLDAERPRVHPMHPALREA